MTILGHCELIKRGACLLVCAALAACAGQALEARGPLPKVEPGQIPFSSYEPEQPFRVAENGVSSRSTFAAPVLPGFRVEVRDLIVAPVEKPSPVPLSGGGLVEFRSGAGLALLGEKELEIKAGAFVSVPDGTTLRVRASGEPVAMRAYLFTAE